MKGTTGEVGVRNCIRSFSILEMGKETVGCQLNMHATGTLYPMLSGLSLAQVSRIHLEIKKILRRESLFYCTTPRDRYPVAAALARFKNASIPHQRFFSIRTLLRFADHMVTRCSSGTTSVDKGWSDFTSGTLLVWLLSAHVVVVKVWRTTKERARTARNSCTGLSPNNAGAQHSVAEMIRSSKVPTT